MASWELLGRAKERASDEPIVAIQRDGRLSLNARAFDDLGGPPAVHLLIDRSAQLLGLRPAEADAADAYPVRQRERARSYQVSARALLTHLGLVCGEKAMRYRAEMIDGVLAVDLTHTLDSARRGEVS